MTRKRTTIKSKGGRYRYGIQVSVPGGENPHSRYSTDYPTPSSSSYPPTASWWPTVTWSPTEEGYQYYRDDDQDKGVPTAIESTSLPTPAPSSSSHQRDDDQQEVISTPPTLPPSVGILDFSLQGSPSCSLKGETLIENKVVFIMMAEYKARSNLLLDDVEELLMDWVANFLLVCDKQALIPVDQRFMDHLDKTARQGSIALTERLGLAKVSSCLSMQEASHYCSILRGEITIMAHPMYIDDFRRSTLRVVEMFSIDGNLDSVEFKYLGPDVPSIATSSSLSKDRSQSSQIFAAVSFLIPLMALICLVHRYRFAILRFRNTQQY